MVTPSDMEHEDEHLSLIIFIECLIARNFDSVSGKFLFFLLLFMQDWLLEMSEDCFFFLFCLL